MEDMHALAYLEEIVNQAEAARIAVDQLNQALREDVGGNAKVWASTQSLLAAGAMLSKLLWPNPPSAKKDGSPLDEQEALKRSFALERARDLRRRLKLRGQPFLDRREVRNAFEHFDDRLDGYFVAGHTYRVDRNIGPRSAIIIDGKVATALRHLDPSVPSVSVLDEEVNLQELWAAIEDTRLRAENALRELRPWS